MAKAKKTAPKSAAAKKNDDATVVRISANDAKPKKQTKPKAVTAKSVKNTVARDDNQKRGILAGFFGYFKGAWQELKLVRWPTRKATWGLTLAVLLFSAFFVVFILLIDAGFKYLFEVIYKQ